MRELRNAIETRSRPSQYATVPWPNQAVRCWRSNHALPHPSYIDGRASSLGPRGITGCYRVTVTGEAVPTFPAASQAFAVITWLPRATFFVFQVYV